MFRFLAAQVPAEYKPTPKNIAAIVSGLEMSGAQVESWTDIEIDHGLPPEAVLGMEKDL